MTNFRLRHAISKPRLKLIFYMYRKQLEYLALATRIHTPYHGEQDSPQRKLREPRIGGSAKFTPSSFAFGNPGDINAAQFQPLGTPAFPTTLNIASLVVPEKCHRNARKLLICERPI